MKRFTIGIDVDDVLMSCAYYAVELANREYKFSKPPDAKDIKSWGRQGTSTDIIFEYFDCLAFYQTQPVLPGAKEFIKELIAREYDVLLITAVQEKWAAVRIKRLREEFPEIPEGNIIIGSRKDICKVDFLVDDAPHNIFDSVADYPILFRRPWNQHITGMLAVNDYTECLAAVNDIACQAMQGRTHCGQPSVVCLVGPSGSGKTSIAKAMVQQFGSDFAIPISYTTRNRREGEEENAYCFITMEEFQRMRDNGDFLENTMYAGNGYGTNRQSIQEIWNENKHAVLPIDMCGAMAMKAAFGDRAISMFVRRSKDKVIWDILHRPISDDDKFKRLVSLNDEYKNEAVCDAVIPNDRTLQEAVQLTVRMIK